MTRAGSAILGAALLLGWSGAAMAEGDAAAGEKVFNKCKACHAADEEKNKIGPHLVGVVGREAGAVEDYRYSGAMMESGLTWDEETLSQYLADPRGMVQGTKMAFAGLRSEDEIANVIAYLKQNGG
jgi:cytochrome c